MLARPVTPPRECARVRLANAAITVPTLARRTDGEATVNTCVCVIMVERVTACQGRVCEPRATPVPRVKRGVLREPLEVDVNIPVCVSTVPTVSTTPGRVCVPPGTPAHTASENAGRIVTVQGVSSSASVGTEVNVILRVGCASVPQDGGDHRARNPVLKGSGERDVNAYATVSKKQVAMRSQASASVLQASLVTGVSSSALWVSTGKAAARSAAVGRLSRVTT
ncbi:uncharacterized protein LOC135102157 [Scylla paramamosain]|uniref:uncharacterized protein LOC135102157 n=1 Tax=Scylla paramamosain TaxID=85552 RepID=UPI003083CE53